MTVKALILELLDCDMDKQVRFMGDTIVDLSDDDIGDASKIGVDEPIETVENNRWSSYVELKP